MTLSLRSAAGGALFTSLALLLTTAANADGGFRDAWQARYPASASYDNSQCLLCHVQNGPYSNWNAYGWNIRQQANMGMNEAQAIAAVEALDSDLDPTGSSNLVEIQADAQPGWTPGPNNRTYNSSGQTSSTATPPASVMGPLDPGPSGLGSSYCGPAVPNSTGLSAVITATGSAMVSANDVTLTASDLPSGQFGYFLVGRSQGSFTPPGSQGRICLSGDIGRYNRPPLVPVGELIVGPTGSLVIDLTSLPTNTPGSQTVMPGESINFQCWYRDNNPTTTSNFTDGRQIMFL